MNNNRDLTRRERFAAMAMQGWIASLGEDILGDYVDDQRAFAEHQAAVAEAAVGYADALIAELDKEGGDHE